MLMPHLAESRVRFANFDHQIVMGALSADNEVFSCKENYTFTGNLNRLEMDRIP